MSIPQPTKFGKLLGESHAHQIARAVFRKFFGGCGRHFAGELVGLADRQSADGVSGEIEVHKLARALAAQIGMRAALHDGE